MATETDLIAAMVNAKLTPFDDKDVVRATMKVVGAGDGLSKSMALAPMEIPIGSDVVIVIRGRVKKVDYEGLKDTPDLLCRDHVIQAGTAMFLDNTIVTKALDEQEEKLRKARDEAKGIQALPLEDAPVPAKAPRSRKKADAPPDPGVTQSGEFKSEAYDPNTATEKATRRRTPAAPKAPVERPLTAVPDPVEGEGSNLSEHG